MEEYLRILRAIHAGRPVSKKDIGYFASFHGGKEFDAASFEKLKTKLASAEGMSSLTDADWSKYMDETKNRLTTDPAYREATMALAQKTGTDADTAKLKAGLNSILAGSDILTSANQIARGNQAAAQVRRPARPPVLQRDQMLAQALNDSQRGTLDQSAAIQPATLANLDQYKADLGTAQTASAGQPGAFGAYAQAASGRRDRANAALVPLGNDIKRQEIANRNQLLGMRMGESQAINQSQSANYGLDQYQFNLDRQAANELGQVGRYNLRNAMTGAAGALVPIGQQLSRQKYNDIYSRGLAYGPEHAQTMAEAAHAADNHWNNNQDSAMYEQAYF